MDSKLIIYLPALQYKVYLSYRLCGIRPTAGNSAPVTSNDVLNMGLYFNLEIAVLIKKIIKKNRSVFSKSLLIMPEHILTSIYLLQQYHMICKNGMDKETSEVVFGLDFRRLRVHGQ